MENPNDLEKLPEELRALVDQMSHDDFLVSELKKPGNEKAAVQFLKLLAIVKLGKKSKA